MAWSSPHGVRIAATSMPALTMVASDPPAVCRGPQMFAMISLNVGLGRMAFVALSRSGW